MVDIRRGYPNMPAAPPRNTPEGLFYARRRHKVPCWKLCLPAGYMLVFYYHNTRLNKGSGHGAASTGKRATTSQGHVGLERCAVRDATGGGGGPRPVGQHGGAAGVCRGITGSTETAASREAPDQLRETQDTRQSKGNTMNHFVSVRMKLHFFLPRSVSPLPGFGIDSF